MERVLVGMSGGVDSSVAAGLLARAGYEVIGCTMLVWSPPGVDMGYSDSCCGLSAAEDARRVAACLGIPHYVLDLRDVFYREVVKRILAGEIGGEVRRSLKIGTVDEERHDAGPGQQDEQGEWLGDAPGERPHDGHY